MISHGVEISIAGGGADEKDKRVGSWIILNVIHPQPESQRLYMPIRLERLL